MNMKLYTSIIFLFYFSTAFSYSIRNRKRQETADWEVFEKCEKGKLPLFSSECSKQYKIVSKILETCENAIEERCNFTSILGEQLTKDNIQDRCDTYYQSDECIEIIDNGISILPECKELDKEYMKTKDMLVKFNNYQIQFSCAEDEYGNICPLSQYFVTDEYTIGPDGESIRKEDPEKFLEDSVNKTCYSKKCTTLTYEIYSKIIEYSSLFEEKRNQDKREYKYDAKKSEEENLKKMLKFLKSENCTQAQPYAPVYDSSNAFSINYNNFSLIILTLIFGIFISK